MSATDLTIKDVATICGVTPPTVRQWIAHGDLAAHRYGPRILRIKPADLHKFQTAHPVIRKAAHK